MGLYNIVGVGLWLSARGMCEIGFRDKRILGNDAIALAKCHTDKRPVNLMLRIYRPLS